MSSERITVLLVDDQHLVRSGFRQLLALEDDIDVTGEASEGGEAVRLARLRRPRVVLMDIRMPGVDGIEATRRIVADDPAVKVLILTTYDTDEHAYEALRAGASGFLLKDCGPAELLHGIRVVARGDALLAPRVTRRLITRFADAAPDPATSATLDVLTAREREVVALVGDGLTNDEIGARLFLSPSTARTHIGRAMTKLGARDRVQLAIIAHRTGIAH